MRLLGWILLLIGIGCLTQSQAFWQSRDSNYDKVIASSSYTGPGDIVSGATGFWGLRAYNAAYAAAQSPLADIVDTSTGIATCTINSNTSGSANLSALSCVGNTLSVTTFCTVTHAGCSVTKLYDQTGNGLHTTQATLAKMPILTLSCLGSLPCMTFLNANSTCVVTSTTNTILLPYTFSVVAERTGNTGNFSVIMSAATAGNPTLNGFNGINFVDWAASGTGLNGAATDNAWHAIGATSITNSTVLYIDNASTSNAVSGSTGSSKPYTIGGSNTCGSGYSGNITEAGAWGVAFSSVQAGNMCHNQFTYWGTSTSC